MWSADRSKMRTQNNSWVLKLGVFIHSFTYLFLPSQSRCSENINKIPRDAQMRFEFSFQKRRFIEGWWEAEEPEF